MKKVVINRCYGGFSISEEASKLLGVNNPYYYSNDYSLRTDEKLIKAIELFGDTVNGTSAKLYVAEYDDTKFTYSINEYDGLETIELIPLLDVQKLATMTTPQEISDYLDSLDVKHT